MTHCANAAYRIGGLVLTPATIYSGKVDVDISANFDVNNGTSFAALVPFFIALPTSAAANGGAVGFGITLSSNDTARLALSTGSE